MLYSSPATTGSAGTEKRKTYNYRVVQVRDGTKIEMKGRCSAGQKVEEASSYVLLSCSFTSKLIEISNAGSGMPYNQNGTS